jgi:hypothetical protein
MKTTFPQSQAGTSWENEIRALEQKACAAFLAADLVTLDELWADTFAVNSPLQKVLTKPQVMGALQSGRIRHLAYEGEIEYLSRRGDLVVVMGRDRVVDPPDGMVSHRRFTNIWQYEGGVWRSVARHAHVVSREPGSPAA